MTKDLMGFAPATPHMSADNNDSLELVADPQKAVRRPLPSITPGRAPIFVTEKQYEPILRLRARRARRKARIHELSFKKRRSPRLCTGRLNVDKGKQERTNPGITQAPSNVPAEDFYGPFIATNEAPRNVPAEDFYGPFIATNEDEEHVGEAAYDSILNLKAPDATELLSMMMGDRYNTDVPEMFKNTTCLESPNFTTLLTAMNNASYDEAAADGYYCVDKVKLKLSGWL